MAEDQSETPTDKPAAPKRKRVAKPAVSAPVKKPGLMRRIWRKVLRGLKWIAYVYAALILLFAVLPPPINLYQLGESIRLGGIEKDWVGWDEIAPAMARSVVAAEDANFCNHWGFDIAAIREEIAEGGDKGRSTLSQQMVKNVFLWHGRSYLRKAMEAVLTPVVEVVWTKRRVLLVYMNTAEFAEGVFGVQAAAQHFWGVDAKDLTDTQAARLAAVLPNPKEYNAGEPGPYVKKRARQILSGAETIATDGRSACFEDAPGTGD